jgi:hypothetical protein
MALPFPFPSLARRPALVATAALAVAVAAVGLGACGGSSDTGTVSTAVTVAPPTTTVTRSTTATSPTTASDRTTVMVSYAGGKVTSPTEVAVKVGEVVVIDATSDVPEEIHVHTYDKKLDLQPGVLSRLTFTADIPGVHEVELEKAHKQLFRLRVQ